ncbi:MAG TPA: plasmid mobilization relaxosome protein MobC [Lachnospiraceae bacterium]|nr:plasmid mobilization relaxosome protein MobC [Lachnospiraceae bacterium]
MSAELGRLGNNMNQIAKHLNSGGSESIVIQWFDNNCRELDDIVMKLKMIYEKKMVA